MTAAPGDEFQALEVAGPSAATPAAPRRGRYVNLRCKRGHTLRARLERVQARPGYAETRIAGRLAQVSMGGTWSVACDRCDASLLGKVIRGHLRPEIRCGPRCTGATGHTCDCACRGKNHGRDHGE